MRVSAAPLRDDAHRIIGAIAVVQDITDQKVAEQALARKRESIGWIDQFGDGCSDRGKCRAAHRAIQSGSRTDVRLRQ
jgi:hypothetical protein